MIFNFPWGVLYIFLNSLLILFYTTSAKRKMILVFISHLVWKKPKLFALESCRRGHVTHVKWNLQGFTIGKKNYLMCYLLWRETYIVSKNKISGIKYNRRKLRKTCVPSDTLISMVLYEKANLHNKELNILTQILVFKLVEIYI